MLMKHFLWVEKYRPTKIEDCILPDSIKKTFKEFLLKGEVPNLLLCGTAGTGKTTEGSCYCSFTCACFCVVKQAQVNPQPFAT